MKHALEQLTYDNRFVAELPGDPEPRNFRRQVRSACYSLVEPTPVPEPTVLAVSAEMLHELDLQPSDVDQRFAEVFGGNHVVAGMQPFAMCYGGHQFGNWAGQLGDGRAINLGEVINRRGQRWVLQLKGAGPTPYSRTADGLAVLRSSVREFLCSEAMFHLGISTTRALSLVATGQPVLRDMFYDGHPEMEPGAVVCRVAPSFVRFGNFEIFASRGEKQTLQQLIRYTIATDFPELLLTPEEQATFADVTAAADLSGAPAGDVIVRWFHEICRRTAKMIVGWMGVGFVHGVMNTDNMSILGLTIDYGPYGWLEDYDPAWTPNTTDAEGRRYCYGNQPQIGMWNLVRLADALLSIHADVPSLQAGIELYAETFRTEWQQMLAAKLGLSDYREELDDALGEELWELLQLAEIDMPIFFRRLAKLDRENGRDMAAEHLVHHPGIEVVQPAFYNFAESSSETLEKIGRWFQRYQQRLQLDGRSDHDRQRAMNAVNPKYVLRNYIAQLAIDDAAAGNPATINELLDLLRHPFDEQPEREKWSEKRPEWARHRAGCSMLSCSS